MLTTISCQHCQARLALPDAGSLGPLICCKCRGIVSMKPPGNPSAPSVALPSLFSESEEVEAVLPPVIRLSREVSLAPLSFGVWWLAAFGGLWSCMFLLVLLAMLSAVVRSGPALAAVGVALFGTPCVLFSLPGVWGRQVRRGILLLLAAVGGLVLAFLLVWLVVAMFQLH